MECEKPIATQTAQEVNGLFIWRRNIVRKIMQLWARIGWLDRGDNVEATKGQNFVRGVNF